VAAAKAARTAAAPLVEHARAKVNLTLRVRGLRADGYHDLESLVVFADFGDRVALAPGRPLALAVRGPTAAAAGDDADNLVLKAARALAARVDGLTLGKFRLDKRLPVAAGLGGGSADAAAALRLLARTNRLRLDDRRLLAAARATGADLPVCLAGLPRVMRGVGERLGPPLALPRLYAVLAHPVVALATKDVFAMHDRMTKRGRRPARKKAVSGYRSVSALLATLASDGNDLEAAAVRLRPVIADVLNQLRSMPGCSLARMSGSGATCFGIFKSSRSASAAARALRRRNPRWWVRDCTLGRGLVGRD
jgi:4-diphosphocytidyl-2-C-methyl-D-erythritol kinase